MATIEQVYEKHRLSHSDFTAKLESMAYDRCHSGGEEEVAIEFDSLITDLAPFIKIYNIGV